MVVINIESGKIRGKIGFDKQDKNFYSFQNIPYAEPPLGELRFKAPQPVRPWQGIKDATREGNESVSCHLITRKFVGSEDCLNLNVYTPELPQNESNKPLKPVMFWIHGGTFIAGSNKTEFHGPEFLMVEDIVLVTINYRLGILGFLSLEDSSLNIPGNAGLKDMVMALKWVQKNIAYFCGDPKNVTVFGESAGGAAAHFLILSSMAKDLFHKVIAQSASALNTWVAGRRSPRVVGRHLGFHSSDDRKLLSFLQKTPAMKLLQAQITIDTDEFLEIDTRIFGPVVERPCNEEAFLSEHPIDIILSGKYNHVPLIMGYNDREGMAIDSIVPPQVRNAFFENMEMSTPLNLRIERGSPLSKKIANQIHFFYFGGVQQKREQHTMQYFNLSTDTVFLRDVYFSVKYHLKTAAEPIYFYKLSLETELNIFKKLTGITVPGACHGDDVGYIFKTVFTPEIEDGSVEDVAQKRVTKLWTNFARHADPTPDSNDQLLKIKWKPVEINSMNYLDIGEELMMKVNPEAERMDFWENIFKNNPAVSKL